MEIVKLAKEAGLIEGFNDVHPSVERFAELVAAHVKDAIAEQSMNDIWVAIKTERDACAKACEDAAQNYVSTKAKSLCADLGATLRARHTK